MSPIAPFTPPTNTMETTHDPGNLEPKKPEDLHREKIDKDTKKGKANTVKVEKGLNPNNTEY